MWFRILRQRGVEIGYGLYLRIGIPVTLLAVLLALMTPCAEVLLVEACS
jgi:Na+/H+ antiporter NhaD/arsenite permease-like protein